MITENKVGTKVHYIPFEGADKEIWENGIIKGHSPELNHYFVVFKCGGDWENYQNYTGQLTDGKNLKGGWI